MKALILAAGLGTRLLPHTLHRPKPLFPIGGIPLLQWTIHQLIHAGCTGIIVNTHHLHDRIEAFLHRTPFPIPVTSIHEPEILDTGGAIKNVRPFMGKSAFFVVNSDIVSNIDLKSIWAFHHAGTWPATLVLHHCHQFNKVIVTDDDFIQGFNGTDGVRREMHASSSHEDENGQGGRGNELGNERRTDPNRLLAFTGIQVLSPDIFNHMPVTDKFSSIKVYSALAKSGDHVKAYIADHPFWRDLGTPEAFLDLSIRHAASKILTNLQKRPKTSCQVTPSSPPSAHALNFKKIGKTDIHLLAGDGSDRQWYRCHIGNNGSFGQCSCIAAAHGIHADIDLLNNGHVRRPDTTKYESLGNSKHKDIHIYAHGLRPTTNHESLDMSLADNSFQINNNKTAYRHMGAAPLSVDITPCEMRSFILIGSHLASQGLPVPGIYGFDLFSGVVYLEDLGNCHLQQVVHEIMAYNEKRAATHGDVDHHNRSRLIHVYKEICDLVIRFSTDGIKGFHGSWTFQTPSYSKSMILDNECRYFMDAFVNSYLKAKVSNEKPLNERVNPAVSRLNNTSVETPNQAMKQGFKESALSMEIPFDPLLPCFTHIADQALSHAFSGLMHRDMQSRNIMVKGDRYYFIDFQSARRGPLQYDLASLLIDPYVNLDKSIQKELLAYCADEVHRLTGFDQKKFITGYRHCAVTRNLQMLGAFGNLTINKGKTHFEQYIPTALASLKKNLKRIKSKATEPLFKFVNDLKLRHEPQKRTH